MKMEPEIKKNYQVKLVEEDTKPVEPERLIEKRVPVLLQYVHPEEQ